MRRMTVAVQWDHCPTCDQAVLTSSWDDRWGVGTAIIVDPTPLGQPEEVACVITDRARYILEATAVKTYRLGRITQWLDEQATFAPALHLPAHRCTARFPGVLPVDVLTHLGLLPSGEPLPDVPAWSRATN